MRRIQNCLAGVGAVCFLAAVTLYAQPSEEIWQISISGHDRGVEYLTFTNDFTLVGYGISLQALGPFAVTGTWTNGSKGIQGTFVNANGVETVNGFFFAKEFNNGTFAAKVHSTIGSQTFKAPAPAVPPSVKNSWVAKGSDAGKKFSESFALAPSTNMAGWFDLTGVGVSEAGSFTVTGAVLMSSDRKAAAYTVSDFGVVSIQAAFVGHLSSSGKRLAFTGQDENGKTVTLHATSNP